MPPVSAQLSLSISLAGGGEETLRAGAASLLRSGLADIIQSETGTAAQNVLISVIQTNTTIVPPSSVLAIANATANSSSLNPSAFLPGSVAPISPSDPALNTPLTRRRRQLQAGGSSGSGTYGSCTLLNLSTSLTTVTVPVAKVSIQITMPANFYYARGALSPSAVAELAANVSALLSNGLNDPVLVQTFMTPFITVWAGCTGLVAQ